MSRVCLNQLFLGKIYQWKVGRVHIERSCSAISGKEERFNGGRHMTLDFRWSNRIVRRILQHLRRKTMLDIILRRNRNIDTRLIELRIISSGITVNIVSGICIGRTDFCVTNIVLASYIARVNICIWNIYFKSCYLNWRSKCFNLKFICEKVIFVSLICFGRSDICISAISFGKANIWI